MKMDRELAGLVAAARLGLERGWCRVTPPTQPAQPAQPNPNGRRTGANRRTKEEWRIYHLEKSRQWREENSMFGARWDGKPRFRKIKQRGLSLKALGHIEYYRKYRALRRADRRADAARKVECNAAA